MEPQIVELTEEEMHQREREKFFNIIKKSEDGPFPKFSRSEKLMAAFALGKMDFFVDSEENRDPWKVWFEILDDTQREVVNDWRNGERN